VTVDLTIERIINPDALIRKLALRDHEGNSRFIAGYANISGIEDSQGEVVTHEALKNAWTHWRANPDYALLNLLHQNLPMAKVIFEPVIDSNGNTHLSGVDDKGLYIVGQVRDDVTLSDEVWEKIERGEYRGFSIGGRNLNPQLPTCTNGKCVRYIDQLELYEVSIVDQPANKASLFNMLKRDDLAKLAEVANKFTEKIITQSVVKISKTRGENCGKYHVIIESDLVDPMTFETEDTRVIREPAEGAEYITLFDHALLRSHGTITGEAAHGGVNPLSLPTEESDTPKSNGDIPLNKEKGNEIRENIEPETPETPKEVAKEPEEAIAPLTMETLAADLARIADRLDNLEKAEEPPAEETPPEAVAPPAETPPTEPVEPAPAKAPTQEEIQQIVQDAVPVPEANMPVETAATEATLEAPRTEAPVAPVTPKPVAAPAPVATPVAPVVAPVETRGVATQTTAAPEGVVPLAQLYGMSWNEIHEMVE